MIAVVKYKDVFSESLNAVPKGSSRNANWMVEYETANLCSTSKKKKKKKE